MHTCACRISEGDVHYCSPDHARRDAFLALSGNQHTFYRAYWRRGDPNAPAPGAAVIGRAKPLPKPPRPAREDEDRVRYPTLEEADSHCAPWPQVPRIPGYTFPKQKDLPEPPSHWSATTRAPTTIGSRSRYAPTIIDADNDDVYHDQQEEPGSHFSAWTTITGPSLRESGRYPVSRAEGAALRTSRRVSDLQSLCTTPDLDQGRFSVASSAAVAGDASAESTSEEEEEEEEEEDLTLGPGGAARLMRVENWLEEAGEKLARLHLRMQVEDQQPTAVTPDAHDAGDVPPPLPAKAKMRHRECSIYHTSGLSGSDARHGQQERDLLRVSTATAREKVYDDLRKHSIFRAYFQDDAAPTSEGGRPSGGKRGHVRRVSGRWPAMDENVPPVPEIPEQFRSQVAKTSKHPVSSIKPVVVKTHSIHPLRIQKLSEPGPPTPPKMHEASPPPATPPKAAVTAAGMAAEKRDDSGEMTPQEYRDSLAAESGWWEPTAVPAQKAVLGEDRAVIAVWAE